jgi:hypothetical protein
MRTVFDNNMVAHLWANQSQHEARSGNGNFYFRDRSLFSYGMHFTVARYLPEDVTHEGQRVVLFTVRNYSVTTQNHKTLARHALNGLPVTVLQVENPDRDFYYNLNAATSDIKDLIAKAKRARKEWTKANYTNGARARADDMNVWASIEGLPTPFPVGCDLLAVADAAIAERKAQYERERAEREARQAANKVLAEQALAEWVAGAHGPIPPQHGYHGVLPTMVRVEGDRLVTSRGAEVPLKDAIRVFRMAARVRAGESVTISNPDRAVGHFTLIGFTREGDIKVGCHTIEFAEAERMARELGLLSVAA